jgi:hypothetical protein
MSHLRSFEDLVLPTFAVDLDEVDRAVDGLDQLLHRDEVHAVHRPAVDGDE